MKIHQLFLLGLMLFFLSGCNLLTQRLVSMPPNYSLTSANDMHAKPQMTCVKPDPDASLKSIAELIAKANPGDTAALELAQRAQAVMLAKELMFRTCEAAMNGWIGGSAVKDAHDRVMQEINSMMQIGRHHNQAEEETGVVAETPFFPYIK